MPLARQKQEFELELLQEENRKRLAEARLVELELTEDLSGTNADFQETLSRLSGASAADETCRIKDRVHNSSNDNSIFLTEVLNSISSTTPTTTTSTALPTVQPPVIVSRPKILVPEPMLTPAPTFSIEPTSVQTFPNVLQQSSPNGVSPIPPMTVVQQPQPIMNATPASTVNAPVIAPPLPQPTRTFAMPANHLLPNMASWTFPTRPAHPLTQVTTVLPPIQPTPTTSTNCSHPDLYHSDHTRNDGRHYLLCTTNYFHYPCYTIRNRATCNNPSSNGNYIYTK